MQPHQANIPKEDRHMAMWRFAVCPPGPAGRAQGVVVIGGLGESLAV